MEKPDDIITLVFCHGMKPTKFQHYLITSTTLLHSTFVVCGKGLKPTDVKTIDSKEEFLKIVWDINRLEEVYSVLIYHAYDLCLEMILPLIKTNFSNSIIISFNLATVFGDPHVYTFDGKEYTFNGKGKLYCLFHRKIANKIQTMLNTFITCIEIFYRRIRFGSC